MLLADLVQTSKEVARTSSRNSKVSLIADMLRQCARGVADGTAPADEIGLATRYLSGSLRQRRTGIELSWGSDGSSSSRGSSWSELPAPPEAGTVTLSELDTVMQDASEMAGAGSSRTRTDLFLGLVARLTADERSFVVGLLRGGLRQGALESVVMTAVAQSGGVGLGAVRRAVAAQGDLAGVTQALLTEGPEALEQFRLSVGRGVAPMLASSAKSVEDALAKTGPAGVEWKLDGIRAQIHKQGNEIRVLTRSLDDITDRVPEVVELISSLPFASAILDGELIALHQDGRPKPFQETGSRAASRVDPVVARARTPLTAYLFDVLHLDGVDLVDEPSRVRRAALERAVDAVHLTPRLNVADVADPAQLDAATAFAADAVARGHEGVVVKADDATYDMGRRGVGWVKVKPVHTLDLVILAVERGNGRRSGWLSNIHLGARDPRGRFGPVGGFVMLGKTFKGLTDEMLRWQSAELPGHAVGPTDGYVIELRPEVVVEIAFDGVQTSPRYPAGLALRFARVVRHRLDKTAAEADPIEFVEQLYAIATHQAGGTTSAQPYLKGGRNTKGFAQDDPRRNVPLMAVATDDNAKFTNYAHPERLVSTDWLEGQLNAGAVSSGNLVVLESDEDVLLYDTGHIPGAVKIDWHLDLNDAVMRDYVNGARFAQVLGQRGIGRDTTVVIYGDKSNWWAAYALWVFTLFGHEDVRLLDGGRAKWVAEGRAITREVPEQTTVDYPVVERNDAPIRAFKDDVLAHVGRPLVDVRSPGEFSGELLHMPDYPQEGAMRGGHIPGARSVPWARAAAEDGTFKSRPDLDAIYLTEQGLSPSDDVVAYCRIGERSSHTWFVLTHLLGFENVRNYDGSWTEWGNAVRVPIEVGAK